MTSSSGSRQGSTPGIHGNRATLWHYCPSRLLWVAPGVMLFTMSIYIEQPGACVPKDCRWMPLWAVHSLSCLGLLSHASSSFCGQCLWCFSHLPSTFPFLHQLFNTPWLVFSSCQSFPISISLSLLSILCNALVFFCLFYLTFSPSPAVFFVSDSCSAAGLNKL